jgi:hypothetical protein
VTHLSAGIACCSALLWQVPGMKEGARGARAPRRWILGENTTVKNQQPSSREFCELVCVCACMLLCRGVYGGFRQCGAACCRHLSSSNTWRAVDPTVCPLIIVHHVLCNCRGSCFLFEQPGGARSFGTQAAACVSRSWRCSRADCWRAQLTLYGPAGGWSCCASLRQGVLCVCSHLLQHASWRQALPAPMQLMPAETCTCLCSAPPGPQGGTPSPPQWHRV